MPNLLLYQRKKNQHKQKLLIWTTSIVFKGLYINELMFSVQKSCYGVMQQAYSMPSIVMNGEQIVSTGQKWCIQV